ncbi:MAG TPA: hypothetical protein DEA82_16965 [Flavobacteriaceae bacterium]|mgnify:CR=1 FL=1|nr:hypothetical protein [Flavobacteriaceae bacterium]|tara:strand:- start:202 stop:1170 length:969 start_codon:yes stop_codon:yes gene_type:complete
MQNMAGYGRNGDTTMGHLTPGETIVPQQVLQSNPQVARGLGRAFTDAGVDPSRYVVGSGQNSINPATGEREFFLDKIIGAIVGNPAISGALGNLALRKIQGKDVSLRDALLGGAVGGGLGALSGGGTGIPFLDNMMSGADSDNPLLKSITGGGASAPEVAQQAANQSKRTEGLLGIGQMFDLNPDEGIGRFLNTKAGEGIASGLAAQLMDSLFSEDEDPDPYGNMARFNRGAGEGPLTLERRAPRRQTDILYRNEGGPAYFPRRNGGIMPSEGSGTKDDVPAMLTAGEFVMTRDAVEGAGNGSLQNGINKMYGMMDNLERKS